LVDRIIPEDSRVFRSKLADVWSGSEVGAVGFELPDDADAVRDALEGHR
jgi:hypothetical protein